MSATPAYIEREGELDALALIEHLVEFDLALARLFELLQDFGIDLAGNVEKATVEISELDEGADIGVLARRDDDQFALFGLLECVIAWRLELDARIGGDAHVEEFARPVHDVGRRQAAESGMRGHPLDEGLAVLVEQRPLLIEIGGNGNHVVADAFAGFADVGLGDGDGAVDDRSRAVREPGVEPAVQGDGGEQRDDDRGQDGDEAEEADETDVKAGAGDAAAAGADEQPELPADHPRHAQDEHEVGGEQEGDVLAAGLDRRQAGQDHIGGETDRNGQ